MGAENVVSSFRSEKTGKFGCLSENLRSVSRGEHDVVAVFAGSQCSSKGITVWYISWW